MRQAIANTVIEGHKPSQEFLADCEKVVTGKMTTQEAIEASAARLSSSKSLTNGHRNSKDDADNT
ncbi:hypothetical protein GCM10027046_31010 [Uliginosibacterium flavum]